MSEKEIINIDVVLFRDFYEFFNKNCDATTKDSVSIVMYKDAMLLFHRCGNDGIRLCPECSKNVKKLVADINKNQENYSKFIARSIKKIKL
jgi:hypothetical protein